MIGVPINVRNPLSPACESTVINPVLLTMY